MPSIDFPALKTLVPMSDVLRLIGWEAGRREGEHLRGPCPIHRSLSPRSRAFAVYRNGFFCHKCRENGDQLRLYATVRNLPIYEACRELCRELGVKVPYQPRRGAGA